MAGCLVTGGTGFLGSQLVAALREGGSEVCVLSRRPAPGARTIVADLASRDLDLSGARFSRVYHLAGLAHFFPRDESERQQFLEVNLEGTRKLLEALRRAADLPEAVLFVSSVAVYGVSEGTLLDENTPRQATDPYGASKRAAEDLLFEWGERHRVRTPVVRLPLVVGNNAPGRFGAMMRAVARHRYFGVGTGSARRSMVLGSDVARILPRISDLEGVFHLTDGYHPSFAELESGLAQAMNRRRPGRLPLWLANLAAAACELAEGVTGRSLPLNRRTVQTMVSTLTFSDARARTEFGWKPNRVLDHLSEMVA